VAVHLELAVGSLLEYGDGDVVELAFVLHAPHGVEVLLGVRLGRVGGDGQDDGLITHRTFSLSSCSAIRPFSACVALVPSSRRGERGG
jgi:hypothetical protein